MTHQDRIVPSIHHYNPENVGPYQLNSIRRPFIHPNQQCEFPEPHSGNEINAAHFQQVPPHILSKQINPASNYRLIPRAELQKHMPRDIALEEVEAGVLADGRAYAPRDFKRQMYLLFPTRRDYILHFLHHYFSRENLAEDRIIRDMMDSNHAVSIERIVEAPRLSAIGTTVDELTAAVVAESKILLHFVGGDGEGYLRRIDGYPGEGSNRVRKTSSMTNGRTSGDSANKRRKSGAGEGAGSSAQHGHGHSSTTQPPQPLRASTTASSADPTNNTATTSSGHDVGRYRTMTYAEAAASRAFKKVPIVAVPGPAGARGSKSTTTPSPVQSYQEQQSRPKSSNVQKGRDCKTPGGRATQHASRGGVGNNKNKSSRSHKGVPGAAAKVPRD